MPAQLAGRSAKCKGCGAKMRVPTPDDADDEVFSIDELEAMGTPAEPAPSPDESSADAVFSMDDLAALSDEPQAAAPSPSAPAPAPSAAPASQTNMLDAAAVSFQSPQAAGKPAKRRSSKQNPVQAVREMWQAFTAAPAAGGTQLPKVRRVSMGGVFLILGAVMVLVVSLLRVSPDAVAAASITMGGPPKSDNLRVSGGGAIVLAVLALIAGGVAIGRRGLLPRAERESPVVLAAFYGMTTLLLGGTLFAALAGGEAAMGIAQLVGLGLGLAIAAFGIWMLYRLSMDNDGSAVLLVILPAVLIPAWALVAALARVEGEGFNWGAFIGFLFCVMITMILMGGAISFFVLLVLPILLLLFGVRGLFGGWVGVSDMCIGAMFAGCYILLVLTRWKTIFKPVAWQFVLLAVGVVVLMGLLTYHGDAQHLADAREAKEESDQGLTQYLVDIDRIDKGVYASRSRFKNTEEIPEGKDTSRLVYLSTGRYITDPAIELAEKEQRERERERWIASATDPVDAPPQPIFTEFVLPRGVEQAPASDADWPVYEPPTLSLAPNQTVDCWGYRLKLLPGYRLAMMGEDDGRRTLRIVGPQLENPSTALELQLIPHPQQSEGGVGLLSWPWLLRSEDLDDEAHFIDYGRIGAMDFARGAPSDKNRNRYRAQIIYLAHTPDTASRVVMRIPLRDRPDEDVLASELMARSIEREPVEMAEPVDSTARLDNSLIQFNDAQIRETRWRTAGVFATAGLYGRAEDTKDGGLGVTYSITGSDGRITLNLEPIRPGQTPAYRVQARGPEQMPGADDAFAGKTIHAFGGYVNYDRLWGDEPFIRVEHGVTSITRGKSLQRVTYYGKLGGYWMSASLYRDPDDGPPMRELEDALRRVRLASALEVADDHRAMTEWVPGVLKGGKADLPLAGGTTLAQAFELDAFGKAQLSRDIDPTTGQYVPVYPPLADEKLEPYKQWDGLDELEKHLGDAERIGPVSIRPIAELKRSARSNDRRTEWFENTGSGRVSISMRIDPLGDDERPITVPVRTDPDTGETLLEIGNRTLREDGEVSVAYRASRGLRVWRIVMPQIGSASLRRCYYIADMPGHRMTISADFERDRAVQLQAIDTSMATLVYHPPAEIE